MQKELENNDKKAAKISRGAFRYDEKYKMKRCKTYSKIILTAGLGLSMSKIKCYYYNQRLTFLTMRSLFLRKTNLRHLFLLGKSLDLVEDLA